MSFVLKATGTDATLELVGKLRIEDATPLLQALRTHCTAATKLQVQAGECLSAEYSILQLLCSASKTVAHMQIITSSKELSLLLARCGLTQTAGKPQPESAEELGTP